MGVPNEGSQYLFELPKKVNYVQRFKTLWKFKYLNTNPSTLSPNPKNLWENLPAYI
jgi:hypothetical protein